MAVSDIHTLGWVKFAQDPQLLDWLAYAGPEALATAHDPAFAEWHRYQNTWFAGVNALDNDPHGAVGGSGPLNCHATDFVRETLKLENFPWDRAQVSICYAGYPKPSARESAAAFRYRRDRDAAHVDGLHPVEPDRRRMMREYHGFVLGIPVTNVDAQAAPLVVWEGSHEIIRDRLGAALYGVPPEEWATIDLTDVYHAARRDIFADCRRVEIHAQPGESYIVHRLLLHGVAPWQEDARGDESGRAIIYFRPEVGRGPQAWLSDP